MRVKYSLLGWAALGALTPGVVLAQAGSVSQPVVQQVPGADGMRLNAALARLGQNPRDIDALIDAGNAALAMGDVDAAVGFFRRAGQLSPTDGRIKAGLAGALVRNADPYTAIPLFAAAEEAGVKTAEMLADRGLAYDMVGDNTKAQGYYRESMALAMTDETVRRLALSQAISRDRRASETTLSTLLSRQDKAAWRTRAFALAILGQQEEAVSIARTTMPEELATAMAPYLRYMPLLTKAQQAAAANLGQFPRASEIGHDDPRMAAFAPAKPAPVQVAQAPVAQPPTRGRRGSQQRTPPPQPTRVAVTTTRATPAAPPEPMPSRQVTASLAPTIREQPAPAPRGTPPAQPPKVTVSTTTAATLAPPPRPVEEPTAPVQPPAKVVTPTPSFDLAQAAGTTRSAPAPIPAAPVVATTTAAPPPVLAPASAPAPTPAPAPAPPPPRARLADAFAEFAAAPPPRVVAPASGAVDIRRITPARDPAAVAKAKPAPPAHPSRIWVQIGVGRDKNAMGFDWRRLSRTSPDLFRGRQPYVSDWGRTNRLLTGPFPSEAAADAFVAKLKKGKVDDAFVWTSPAGQVVDQLGG